MRAASILQVLAYKIHVAVALRCRIKREIPIGIPVGKSPSRNPSWDRGNVRLTESLRVSMHDREFEYKSLSVFTAHDWRF
eukprot:COSAG02_NODE_12658_length_1513_cov_2.401697_1_plen_79_part_10